MLENTHIQNKILDYIANSFGRDRVVCIIAYGSSLSNSKIAPGDYDFLILLKTYHPDDYQILKESKSLGYSIELFVDYLDYITIKGLEYYQRGRHGTYFFKVLANAKCIYGENFYKNNISHISPNVIKKDLLHRIEEYFYRIQKHYLNDEYNDKTINSIKKYISRICMDLLLFTEELSFEEVHQYHYLQIINTHVLKSGLFSTECKDLLKEYFIGEKPEKVLLLIPSLYKVYLECFEQNNK